MTSAKASAPLNKRQPPILNGSANCGEVAGRTAAECAAVCCCCPCSVVSLLVYTLVKLPAGLCRRAYLKRRRRRRMKRKSALLGASVPVSGEVDDKMMTVKEQWGIPATTEATAAENDETEAKMEAEMWSKFDGTGFWRSPSQREDPKNE